MKKLTILMVACSALLAGSVYAQQAQENITLRIKNGAVMTSNGGEFVTAQSGQGLVRGEKLSVSNATYAQAVYDRGTEDTRDDCIIEFKAAGVYEVPGDCKPAGAWQANAGGVNMWIVAGVAVGLGLELGNGNNTPVSSGAL
ncbi:hypothetical protein [Thermomonas sp.]|uniref:hypothetical protein n=1 Tax=Thermomonas sp. TaxID=1971895 RepID=UPI00260CD4E9|nr:hypothetical protein [Thermomonas sp.]MCO5054659.1 hypothetical protein [Thermomonas sp.]